GGLSGNLGAMGTLLPAIAHTHNGALAIRFQTSKKGARFQKRSKPIGRLTMSSSKLPVWLIATMMQGILPWRDHAFPETMGYRKLDPTGPSERPWCRSNRSTHRHPAMGRRGRW